MKNGCRIAISIPILLFGLLFTAIGGFWLATTPTTRSYVETTGIVVDLSVSSGSDANTYAPVIEYLGPEGAVYRITSNLYRSPAPGIGDTVGVLYSPDDPSDAVEKTSLRIIIPSIFLVVGIGVLFLGFRVAVRGFTSSRRVAGSGRTIVIPGASPTPSGQPAQTKARPTTAQFRRVEPRGPDDEGRFQHRVVARDEEGGVHYSEWLDEDPTTAMVVSGSDELRIEWRGDQSYVVGFPT